MCGRPGEAGLAPAKLAGAPRGQWPADGTGKACDECNARDCRSGVCSVDPSQRRERGVIESDAHSHAQHQPGKPQHCLRVCEGEGGQSCRDDDVGEGEHLPAADGVDGTTDTWADHRGNDQRTRKGGEEPRARDAQIVSDAVGKDGGKVVAGRPCQTFASCPAQQ